MIDQTSNKQHFISSALTTERPKLGNLNQGSMEQMNRTFNFNQESKMSIDATARHEENATTPMIKGSGAFDQAARR